MLNIRQVPSLIGRSAVIGAATVVVIAGASAAHADVLCQRIVLKDVRKFPGTTCPGPNWFRVTTTNDFVGPQGETGPQGPQGDVGPQGPQGDVGPQGIQGVAGPQGERGERGLRGERGPRGEEGEDGEDGERGPRGFVGPQGPVGATGPAGAQGEQGPAGAQGLQGETGPQGVQGPVGPQGDVGPQGLQGERGLQGEQGLQGQQGPVGATGPAGADGQNGADGIVNVSACRAINGSDQGNLAGTASVFLTCNAATEFMMTSGFYTTGPATAVLSEQNAILNTVGDNAYPVGVNYVARRGILGAFTLHVTAVCCPTGIQQPE